MANAALRRARDVVVNMAAPTSVPSPAVSLSTTRRCAPGVSTAVVLNRHRGPYPNQFFVEIAEFIQQTRQIINPDPFEHEVVQTAKTLLESGNLKMALFRLHEVIEARIEGRLF
jgi:hypothetical protein